MARKISRNPAPKPLDPPPVEFEVADAKKRRRKAADDLAERVREAIWPSKTYVRHPVPYALSRTVGGQERGYVMVGPDWAYQVIPTSKGLILEQLDNETAGTTDQRVTKTREYTINPKTLEIK